MNSDNRDYSDLILPIEERSAEELKKHTKGKGKRYVFSDHRNNPDGNIYCIVRTVRNIRKPSSHVEMHSHNADSLWLFIGDGEKLEGLQIQVKLGDNTFDVSSPASIYIPAGVEHTYNLMKGSGKYINIVLAKGGEYNTVTK